MATKTDPASVTPTVGLDVSQRVGLAQWVADKFGLDKTPHDNEQIVQIRQAAKDVILAALKG